MASDHAPAAIETDGLTKRFGDVAVVDNLSLSVPAGSVYGFLGPNGSGKTTTIRMLLGLIRPTSGSMTIFGRRMPDAAGQVLPEIGALVEGPAFYPWLSGRRNLIRLDAAGPDGRRRDRRERIDTALERVGLLAAADKRYGAYSLGMRQRLAIAGALSRPRRLFVLDEPSNGLDPQGTREMRHLVKEMAAQGTTVFVSSHLLSEVEQTCSHVAVISLGRVLAQGAITDLQAPSARLRVETADVVLAATVLERVGLAAPAVDGDVITAALDGHRPEDCCRMLVEAGVGVHSLTTELPSLEDIFVELTGEGFDVAR
jgi:ABC-2 type transport system ATP-binding protein